MVLRALRPATRTRLLRIWIVSALGTLFVAVSTVGMTSRTTVNGRVTSSTVVDIGKLVGGPALVWYGLQLVRTPSPEDGSRLLRATGAVLVPVGLALLVWGVLRL